MEKSSSKKAPKPIVAPEIEQLVNQIGDFIQYWGFKHVQGRIWAHLFISSEPLDASELMRRLDISKALVSISIKEMLEYAVVEEAGKSERGTTLYRANSNQEEVILNVLRRRERMMLSQIASAHKLCESLSEKEKKAMKISEEGFGKLGDMISYAEGALDLILRTDDADKKMWQSMGTAFTADSSEKI